MKVNKGRIKRPISCVAYGPDGVGKSTFAAGAPSPIFLGAEGGCYNLDVSRFDQPKNFSDAINNIKELIEEEHSFQTLVIDSLDWLEPMLWKDVCKEHNAENIELVHGGYGKGYTIALDRWHEMIRLIATLQEKRQMHFIAIAHSEIKAFHDPINNSSYDRFQLKLQPKAAALWREKMDAVLFCNYEVFTKTEKGKTKAFGDGARLMFTERRPAFDAKNRYQLPFSLPLS